MHRTCINRDVHPAKERAQAHVEAGGPTPKTPKTRFFWRILLFFGPLGMPEAPWGRQQPAHEVRARADGFLARSCPKPCFLRVPGLSREVGLVDLDRRLGSPVPSQTDLVDLDRRLGSQPRKAA